MRAITSGVLAGAIALTMSACNELTGTQALPAGTSDPGVADSPQGASRMAVAARGQFQFSLAAMIQQAGLLTDELEATTRNVALANDAVDPNVAVDSRAMVFPTPSGDGSPVYGTDLVYGLLQQTRALAHQAIGALATYSPDSSAHRRAELYAIEGYSEVMLADLFCSGVPLSQAGYKKPFVYEPGSTTSDVYTHAVALFDSATTLAGDSAAIVNLASVGKGRALLALGKYAEAGQAVSNVPSDFQYSQSIQTCGTLTACAASAMQPILDLAAVASASDLEGANGLPYASSGDPRTARLLPSVGTAGAAPVWFPAKYTYGGVSNVVVASGTESQLIAAEAALHSGSATWLTILNALRTTCPTVAGCATPAPAGTGGVAGLPPLTDPGTDAARVALLFQERAYWLYLTGERQGDLRRLVTQYHVAAESVYPSAPYAAAGVRGTNIDAPIPLGSSYGEATNPYFHGCLSRD